MAIVYRSKIDTWLIVVLAAAVAVSLYATFKIVSTGNSGNWPTLFVTIALGVCLPLWVLVATRYTLDTQVLKVTCGPFRWTVPLREVASITPSSNPIASPALSLDRLRIEYEDGRVILISPRDRDAFMRAFEINRAAGVARVN